MIHKLYDAVFDNRKDRKDLYIKCDSDKVNIQRKSVLCSETNIGVDLCTYFNSFSVKKWKQYTTIKNVIIKADIIGIFDIEIYGINKDSEVLLEKINDANILDIVISLEDLEFYIIALKITSKYVNSKIENITYYGDFETWESKKIGVVICTFQREGYVQRTINKLLSFSNEGNDWLSIVVVDNGRSLEETNRDNLKIIHNPNFGGSGGFTRGIIENLENNINDYVLLMDDDIDIDTTALERTYALLSSLKDEYKESFLSGAMLNIDEPCMQYENTAYWNKYRFSSLGFNFNLAKKENCVKNTDINEYTDQYAAWWYCCIPLKRIFSIGLPMPLFVKGDDIEYSIRNKRKIIFLNGIAVWHEPFSKKNSAWVNYFSDRNMLLVNILSNSSSRRYFSLSLTLRIIRRIVLDFNKNSLWILSMALMDFKNILNNEYICRQDEFLHILRRRNDGIGICYSLIKIMILYIEILFNYKKIKTDYKKYINNNLIDSNYWKQIMYREV